MNNKYIAFFHIFFAMFSMSSNRVHVSQYILMSKVPKVLQQPKFNVLIIVCGWHMSPITMEIDARLLTYFYLDYVGTT